MKIVSRYLIRQFSRTFLMTFSCLLGVMVVADFVGHLSEFLDHSATHGSILQLLIEFYGARVPWFFDVSSRIVAVLSAVLVVATLQRHAEFTALQAAGISRWRIVAPLLMGCGVIAVLAALNRELVIPNLQEELSHDTSALGGSRATTMVPKYDPRTSILFEGQSLDLRQGRIDDVVLRLPVPWGPIGRTVCAKSAVRVPPTEDRPGGYRLLEVADADRLQHASSISDGDQTVLFAPGDTDWLEPGECFVVSDLPPEAFRDLHRWHHYSSTWQLVSGIRGGMLDNSPHIQVMIHARGVQPVLDMVLAFLGLPGAIQTQRRHMVSAAAKSLLAVSVFSLVVVVCHALGTQGAVRPSMAAWLPLIVLGPIAVLNFRAFDR